jgi:hypothetical protein
MCGKSKGGSPPPPAPPPQVVHPTIAEPVGDAMQAQRDQAIASQTKSQSFGAELGATEK